MSENVPSSFSADFLSLSLFRLQMTDPNTINHLTDFKDKLIDPITKVNYPWILHLVDRMNATWVAFDRDVSLLTFTFRALFAKPRPDSDNRAVCCGNFLVNPAKAIIPSEG